jgi:predicted O-methyltransferase YrrM
VFEKARTGGFIIADNVLWGGKIEGDEASKDPQTRGMIMFNEKVHDDQRVEKVILPVRDGILIVRKK